MKTLDIYESSDWTIMVVNGVKRYSGHDRLSDGALTVLKQLADTVVIVNRRYGEFTKQGSDYIFTDESGMVTRL